MGDLFPGFKEMGTEGGQRVPPASAVSVSIQSNLYTKVAHLGAACPWSTTLVSGRQVGWG